jgi:hypothetical protein
VSWRRLRQALARPTISRMTPVAAARNRPAIGSAVRSAAGPWPNRRPPGVSAITRRCTGQNVLPTGAGGRRGRESAATVGWLWDQIAESACDAQESQVLASLRPNYSKSTKVAAISHGGVIRTS